MLCVNKCLWISSVVLLFIVHNIKSYEVIKVEEYYLMPPINDVQLADIDQCKIQGAHKYCAFELKLNPLTTKKGSSDVWNIIEKVNSNNFNFQHDIINKARCVSKRIGDEEIIEYHQRIFNEEFYRDNLSVNITNFYCNTFDQKSDMYNFRIMLLLCLFVVFVVFCSLLHFDKTTLLVLNTNSRNILSCFSIQRNWNELLNAKESYIYTRGIRFINILLVLTVHTGMFIIGSNIRNTIAYEHFSGELNFNIFWGLLTITSMQIFFYLSGFFLSLSIYKAIDRGEFNLKFVLITLLKRYLRLTPVLFVMILLATASSSFEMESPYSGAVLSKVQEMCRKNWWRNIFYINNLGISINEMCLLHSWFLAADFQLHFISLILLSVVWLKRTKTVQIFAAALFITILIPGIITYSYNLHAIPVVRLNFFNRFTLVTHQLNPVIEKIYLNSWTNASSHILGLIVGYLFHEGYMDKPLCESPKSIKWLKAIWYFIMIAIGITFAGAIVLLNPSFNNYNRTLATIFAALHKPFFTCGLIFFIWGLHQNFGKLFKLLLECKPIVILGRLTYSLYLIHMMVITWFVTSDKSTLYLNGFYIVEKLIYYTLISYGFALMSYLFVEAPFRNLVKLVFKEAQNNRKAVEVDSKTKSR